MRHIGNRAPPIAGLVGVTALALASFGAGYLSDQMGWGGVFLIIGGAALLSTLSAYMISRDFQRRAAEASK